MINKDFLITLALLRMHFQGKISQKKISTIYRSKKVSVTSREKFQEFVWGDWKKQCHQNIPASTYFLFKFTHNHCTFSHSGTTYSEPWKPIFSLLESHELLRVQFSWYLPRIMWKRQCVRNTVYQGHVLKKVYRKKIQEKFREKSLAQDNTYDM